MSSEKRPTRRGSDRLLRELGKIRDGRVLDLNELAWLGAAMDLLAAYPLPPEDGERAEVLAQWLEGLADPQVNSSTLAALTRAARRACGVAAREGDRGELLRHVAALLRQPQAAAPPSGTEDRIADLSTALAEIRRLADEMPCGADHEADPAERSPRDALQHVAGLIWRTANVALRGKGGPEAES